ncbi:DUF4345 family protein [Planctomicrobium sp.]|nr:DUF4345 family protein [Planctomicrobium sp.]MDA7527812.1 DUF4345 family protein [bacterium]MDB4733103.1 DUF4345 family protein [Planctomicrobium sp.]MDB4793194.1 DUF4345 family protein [bacterium]
MARFFLAFIGITYIGLGLWCAIAPQKTSKAVGFDLQAGQGQSEFLTVYGGLEVALGILFLWPLYRSEEVAFPLFACLVVHACLVLFRTIGFFMYTEFETTTYFLAAIEWIIFLGTTGLLLSKR